MAHLLLRPLRTGVGSSSLSHSISRSLSSRLPIQRCSNLSSYAPLRASAGRKAEPMYIRPSERAQPSHTILAKKAGAIPNDLGMMPHTFVCPRLSSLPRNPVKFVKITYSRIYYYVRNYVQRILFSLQSPHNPNSTRAGKRWWQPPYTPSFLHRNVPVNAPKLTSKARELHSKMYEAFAQGNTGVLRRICLDGMYNDFQARLRGRPQGDIVTWELVKYTSRSVCLSHRSGVVPGLPGAGVRQAVVRIASKQRLKRVGRDGRTKEDGIKDVVEFIVLQKFTRGWREEEWRIWGMTKETGLSELKRWKQQDLA